MHIYIKQNKQKKKVYSNSCKNLIYFSLIVLRKWLFLEMIQKNKNNDIYNEENEHKTIKKTYIFSFIAIIILVRIY